MTKKSCVMGMKSRTLTIEMVAKFINKDRNFANIRRLYIIGKGKLVNITDAENVLYSIAFMFPLRGKFGRSKVEYMLYYPADNHWSHVTERPNVCCIRHDDTTINTERGIMQPVMIGSTAALQISTCFAIINLPYREKHHVADCDLPHGKSDYEDAEVDDWFANQGTPCLY